MQDVLTVKDEAAAAVFASLQQRKIVQTLIPQALTLSALAKATQTPMSLLHYHVSKCMKLGLIHIERTEPRAGRAIKHYRAAARTFFVPSALLPSMPGAEMTRQLRDVLDRHQARTVQGVSYLHDERHPRLALVKDSSASSAATELWLDVGLAPADAAELFAQMRDLLDRYSKRDKPNQPRYLVHMSSARTKPA
jgi:hypothetical protein